MAPKPALTPEPLFEVLTRNRHGRETVHRHRGATADAAVGAMADATGVDRAQVVTVEQVPGT